MGVRHPLTRVGEGLRCLALPLPTRLEQLWALRVRRPLPGIPVTTMRYSDDYEGQNKDRNGQHLRRHDAAPSPAHGWFTAIHQRLSHIYMTQPTTPKVANSTAGVSTLSPSELVLIGSSSQPCSVVHEPSHSGRGNVLAPSVERAFLLRRQYQKASAAKTSAMLIEAPSGLIRKPDMGSGHHRRTSWLAVEPPSPYEEQRRKVDHTDARSEQSLLHGAHGFDSTNGVNGVGQGASSCRRPSPPCGACPPDASKPVAGQGFYSELTR